MPVRQVGGAVRSEHLSQKAIGIKAIYVQEQTVKKTNYLETVARQNHCKAHAGAILNVDPGICNLLLKPCNGLFDSSLKTLFHLPAIAITVDLEQAYLPRQRSSHLLQFLCS
jgi:hypothetical protein